MSEPTTNGARCWRCWRCGRGKDEASALEALSWVCDRSSGRPQWLCDRCARDQVRNIESKLPTEYW